MGKNEATHFPHSAVGNFCIFAILESKQDNIYY